MASIENQDEWLEADGLGGFASGPARGPRTRRYHAWLLAASNPPTGRMLLVSGAEVFVETPAGRYALSSERFMPDVVHPDGVVRQIAFTTQPWPTWTWRCEDGTEIRQELFVTKDTARVVVSWTLLSRPADVRLIVRPLLAGRDPHALMRENTAFRFAPERVGASVTWRPYPGVPRIVAQGNGSYEHAPLWYRSFLYTEERARGLDQIEDLAAPGMFTFELARGVAWLGFATEPWSESFVELQARERARRAGFASPWTRAADAYLVRRGTGRTIVAGYPWFTDWGRDTFLAMRGLCIATGRLDDARQILVEWAGTVDQGMLPNRFVESGAPEFNSVDASLWFVIAVAEWLRACARTATPVAPADRVRVLTAVRAILAGYRAGTRHGIRRTADGLLAAGEPGVQLTWMDAKVGGWVVTPRIGKPVEVQALWLNALALAAELFAGTADGDRAARDHEIGRGSFRERFWNAEAGCLHDIVDVDHEPGRTDALVRPNQVLAIGGLPHALLDGTRARSVLDVVVRELLTPLGLRTLSPRDPRYRGRYEGGVTERDGAYHQGTVWPWLLGPFADAWLRVHGVEHPGLFAEIERRFAAGHVAEIADGDAPHAARGCPFQAWSLGELLRVRRA